jgi:putative flippase GtrA
MTQKQAWTFKSKRNKRRHRSHRGLIFTGGPVGLVVCMGVFARTAKRSYLQMYVLSVCFNPVNYHCVGN